MNVITKYYKPTVVRILSTHVSTCSRYGMRKPFDKDGRWSGWTAEEVEAHLKRIREYREHLPKEKPSNGNGC